MQRVVILWRKGVWKISQITEEIPQAIFDHPSRLWLVTDLQTNVKAMRSEAYARKVKITNLQQMANTLFFLQEHGYDTRLDLENDMVHAGEKLAEAQEKLKRTEDIKGADPLYRVVFCLQAAVCELCAVQRQEKVPKRICFRNKNL